MRALGFKGRGSRLFVPAMWLWLLAACPSRAFGHFMGDMKAVVNGSEDHWTLQNRASVPLHVQMTVCVDIRVVVPGAWVAFTYSSVHASKPELGLEGDEEALYGWLLRVRHRFPLQLSPLHWHRVCLKRDGRRNSFSLKVDGRTVSERRVIARAVPPSGSLWLGRQPRNRRPRSPPGAVELYLFRMWADLGDHGQCEDGTVIGWNTQYWDPTSPRTRQRDPNLQCARTGGLIRSLAGLPVVPSASATLMTRTSQVTGSSLVNCDISQLCSNESAYFWMSISVEAKGGNKTEQDVGNLLSDAFSCAKPGDFMDFCEEDRQLQEVQVTCKEKSDIRNTTCNVLLQLSRALPACELQRTGGSALQQAGGEQIRVRIMGEVERVGKDLCEGMAPSGGRVVRCTSTSASSLDDVCQAERRSPVSCSVIERDSFPAAQPKTGSCSRETSHVCDCTASCNSASHFFATRVRVNSTSADVESQLSRLLQACPSVSVCQKFSKNYKVAHLECHLTSQSPVSRLYTCFVMVEMSGSVNSCTLNKILQQDTWDQIPIVIEQPLRRMVVCGPPDLPVQRLLTSNLTWVAMNWLTAEVCQPVNSSLQCGENERVALLLTDSCSSATRKSTTQPSTGDESVVTSTPSASPPTTGVTGKPDTTAAVPRTSASRPDLTQPALRTSSPVAAATLSGGTAGQNATESTSLQNTTTGRRNTTEALTFSPLNPIAATLVNSTPNTTVTAVSSSAATSTTTPTTGSEADTRTNVTTLAKSSTVVNVVDNTSEPSVSPLIDQAGNHTMTATSPNYTTSSPTIKTSEVPRVDFNSSVTASNLTTDVDQTIKEPVVSLTAVAGDASLEATVSTTTATATTTARGHIPAQTEATATLQTTTLTSATTAKPGTGTTPAPGAETTKTHDASEKQANELLDQTQDASQLNSLQVAQLVERLERLLDGPAVSQAVGQLAVNIISNLMECDSAALSTSANRLIQAVDDLGVRLVVAGDSVIVTSTSLVLAVAKVDGTNFSTTSVDIFDTDDIQLRTLSRSRSRRSGSALGSVFLPSSLTTGLIPEQQQQASRVQFTFYTRSAFFQDAALDNRTLVSPILGSSVANLSLSNLPENIQFTIRNINPIHANYTASCAFWDFTLNGGGGGWSNSGCSLVSATSEETTCSCNHLTSFAILLDLSREDKIDQKQAQVLTFITYIGCGTSAVFLAATLLTYLSFRKLLRDIPAKILVQLCVSLLLLNLVFLLDSWLALYPVPGLCISTAFFLHYFLLTSFTWAGLEALHMYLSVVQVFTPYLSRYMLKFSLVGWGLPLVVVIVVISVDKDNYGLVTYGNYTDGTSDEFCWLREDVAFYVGVVAYFLLVFVLCLLVFIMVMVQLARIKKQNPQNQSPNRGVLTDMRSIAGLVVLLGLTWGFALFAWGPLYLPFVFLFAIFNSLQGFLVFIFHCAAKEKVRRQWRTHLCCGRLRLAENSEWSHMAAQNKRTTEASTATTSAPHFNSRSSSVISDGTNSSGSVFADSGISDGCSTDVVLNEIHRQNRWL